MINGRRSWNPERPMGPWSSPCTTPARRCPTRSPPFSRRPRWRRRPRRSTEPPLLPRLSTNSEEAQGKGLMPLTLFYWVVNFTVFVHSGASAQSWCFVMHFLNVPPAIGQILQRLCSPIGYQNFLKKTQVNIKTERTPQSVCVILLCLLLSWIHGQMRALR